MGQETKTKVAKNAVDAENANTETPELHDEELDFTPTGILVSRDDIKKYAFIEEPRTQYLVVASVSPEMPQLDREGNAVASKRPESLGQPLYKRIVNFRAIASDRGAEVKAIFAGRDSVDLGELNGLTLSGNTRPYLRGQESQELPMAGEKVKANIGMVISRTRVEGEEIEVLGVTSFATLPALTPKAFSFDDDEEQEDTVK